MSPLLVRCLAVCSLMAWGCGPAPAEAETGAPTAEDDPVDPLLGTQLVLREAALGALVDVLEQVPDSLPVPTASENLRVIGEQHMPALEGSWADFQAELAERVSEDGYGARAQDYQALKGRFEAEVQRLQEDATLWRNLAPKLVRFNAIFQP